MATYPDEAYSPVMDYYKHLPEYLKPKANEVLADFEKRYKQGDAPPEEMLSSLKALASKKEGGLEAKVQESEGTISRFLEGIGRTFSNPLVPATVTALALLYTGILYMPP